MPRATGFPLALAFASSLLLQTGCAHYSPHPVEPQRSLTALENRRLTDPQILSALRERAGDATFTAGADALHWGRAQLLVAALELNPKVREARAALAQSAAAGRSARAIQNPTLSLASEYDLTRAAESPWLWGLASSVLVDAFVSRGLRIDLAQATLRGAGADFQESLWDLRHELRAALLAVALGSRRIEVLEGNARARAEFLRLARARVEAGESAGPEALQADLELARTTSALDDARSALVDSRAKLAAALGVPSGALAGLRLEFEELDAPMPVPGAQLQPLRERALLSRGDLARAIADYDARELELKQQSGAQYLQASLGPGYTYDHGVRKLTLGASLSLPLFNHNEGPVAEARAAREVAGEHVLVVQAGILSEIDTARAAYTAALEALQRTRAQRLTSESIARATRRELDADATDRPTLLVTELSASTERLAELDALDRAQQALGQLEDALRAPLSGPEVRLHVLDSSGNPLRGQP